MRATALLKITLVATAAVMCAYFAAGCKSSPPEPGDGGPDGSYCKVWCNTVDQCKPGEQCIDHCCRVGCKSKLDCKACEDCIGGKCQWVGCEDAGVDGGDGGDGGLIACDDGGCPPGDWCNIVSKLCEAAPLISVSPDAGLNFGSVPYGQSKTMSMDIANVGKLPLTITGYKFETGTNPDPKNPIFTIVSGGETPTTLNPTESHSVGIKYKQIGAVENKGGLTISSNDPGRPIYTEPVFSSYKGVPNFEIIDRTTEPITILYPTPSNTTYEYTYDLGYVAPVNPPKPKHFSFAMANMPAFGGDAILEIKMMESSSTTAGKFDVKLMTATTPPKTLSIPAYLNAGEMDDLSIDYTPPANPPSPNVHDDYMTYKIVVNETKLNPYAPTDSDTLTLTLHANYSTAKITVLPGSLDFGEVKKGTTTSKTVVIKNEGTSSLVIKPTSGLDPDPKYSTDFSLGSPFPTQLNPGDTFTQTVIFTPGLTGSTGPVANILHVDSDDPRNPSITVPIAGTETDPTLKVVFSGSGTPPNMDFGQVQAKNPKNTYSQTVTLSNSGTLGDLTITNISIRTQEAQDYSLSGVPPAPFTPFPLNPGEANKLIFTVELKPSETTASGSGTTVIKYKYGGVPDATYTISMNAQYVGNKCTQDNQCGANFCRQGRCCATECDGICNTCASPTGNVGYCLPKAKDTPCGVICDQANQQGYLCDIQDSKGVCVAQTPCLGYYCDMNTGKCLANCEPAQGCQPPTAYSCVTPDNLCKLNNGQPCQVDDDCANKHCFTKNPAGGVCCNEACNAKCERCDNPTGTCTAVTGGTDPFEECEKQAETTCQQDGNCSGKRGQCELWPVGTQCSSPACTNGNQSLILSSVCDGNGTCKPPPDPQDCNPYMCDVTASPNACFTNCTDNNQCNPANAVCNQLLSLCKINDGKPCRSDPDCNSTYCTDSVCCKERCEDKCETCKLTQATAGLCNPVPAGESSQGKCPDETNWSCKTNGLCDGNRGGCQYYAEGTLCAMQQCLTITVDPLLEGSQAEGQCRFIDHTCTPGAITPCTNNLRCDDQAVPPQCFLSCSSEYQCLSGFMCDTVTHTCKSAGSCESTAQCLTGFSCCTEMCINTKTDVQNCGACGTVCGTAHTTNTACVNSVCKPTCQSGYANCSGNPNTGCETDINTPVNTRTSAIGGPVTLSASGNNTCGWKVVSDICAHPCKWVGAQYDPGTSATGTSGKWIRGEVTKANNGWNCDMDVAQTFILTAPAGASYQVCIYPLDDVSPYLSCATAAAGSSGSLFLKNVSGYDSAWSYVAEVKYISGTTCGQWTLKNYGYRCCH